MTEHILYEKTGSVARISHNRPKYSNAESSYLLREIHESMHDATNDKDIKVIILSGEGKHFSAGHDLKQAATERASFTVEERWQYETEYYLGYAMEVWDCPKPTIAEVQGACISGGFMLANMCDLVIASDDAFFGDPVIHTIGTASVEVLVHPWVMGMRRSKDFLFTGRRMYADEALASGMVNKVVSREKLREAAMQMAEKIAEADPFALMLTKRALNRTQEMQGFRAALSAHFDTHQLSHLSDRFIGMAKTDLSKSYKS